MRALPIWLCSIPFAVQAQISGVIGDSVAQRRIPGAVVTALDANQRVVGRALADDSGRFRIENAAGARRLRVVKIGYRLKEAPVSQPASVRVYMERLPNLLEPVQTTDEPKCPRNPTRPAAFGLWEQARAALLGNVVARQTATGFVRRLNYWRYMEANGTDIVRQSVRRDSGLALRSFNASYPAAEFMTRGFAEPEGKRLHFYGPDAEVLLDDALVESYCLEIAAAQPERPNQVGLRFRPMTRQIGRVDLDGTLWIDTLARTLRDIEFVYLGLDRWATPLRPGGSIAFREMTPAILWIDQWWLRMMGARIDSGRATLPVVVRRLQIVEAGAELASTRWEDSTRWDAKLGAAEITLARASGVSLRGARAWLDSTDYEAVSDSTGVLRLDELLPGPYTISVFDSTLAQVDTALPARPRFMAARDSVSRVAARVPSLVEFMTKGCMDQESFDRESMMLAARILGSDGLPVVARWRLETTVREAKGGVIADGIVGTDGMVFVCKQLAPGKRVVLRVWPVEKNWDKDPPAIETPFTILRQVTAVKVVLPP